MSREAHVRICESLGVRFPWATRLLSAAGQDLLRIVVSNLIRKKVYFSGILY
jgi:hypothetical protein